jgi:hypothetical protein
MGTERRVLVTAVAVGVSLGLGCSGDDGGRRQEPVEGDAAELAVRLGCDRTAPGHRKGWDQERPVECYADEGWAATIHAPLSGPGRTSALHLLASRYGNGGRDLVPCPDGSYLDDVSVIAGRAWIVVVTNDRGADRVVDRLGGQIQPADETGPPISYFALPCPDPTA